MNDKRIEEIAHEMLRTVPQYLSDACKGASLNNSKLGAMLSMTYGIPRWVAEEIVRRALARLAQESKRHQDNKTTRSPSY